LGKHSALSFEQERPGNLRAFFFFLRSAWDYNFCVMTRSTIRRLARFFLLTSAFSFANDVDRRLQGRYHGSILDRSVTADTFRIDEEY